jgi:hypothetical protein
VTTEEQKAQASQSEQHSETKKGSETASDDKKADDVKANAIAEGRRKAMEDVAKAVGVNPKNLDLAQLAEAVKAKKAADDAAKTAEERYTEVASKAEALESKNQSLLSMVAKRVDADFNALSEEAKGFVSEFAGDDPEERMRYMASESFQKLTAKQGPRTQGTLQNGPTDTGESKERKAYDELVAKATDMSLSAGERAEHSQSAQRYRRANAKAFG